VTATSVEKKVNGTPLASAERGFDAVALAQADAIRARAEAEAKALRIEAEGRAEAEKIKAAEEAEKLRLENERKRMRLEKDQADHVAHLARKAAEKAKAEAEQQKTEQAAEEKAEREAQQLAEQERAERWWKWGARGIYAVGLIIAAPVQFMHFWDPKRPFLVAAPGLLEGLALVLAFGAAWAVAHRRDVAPYRVGIMLGAAIAAAINLYGGMTDPAIGFNAGLIGAIASLGGPIVLMAYEHGIAQKADGIPSWRERRAAEKAEQDAAAAREKSRAEKKAAEEKAAAEKAEQQARAEEEQRRKDEDRKTGHPKVWEVADAMRSARGSQYVTEQIWADAWYRVTGSKVVGVTPEIEELTQAAAFRMKVVAEAPIRGEFSLVDSHRPARDKKAPDAPDGRRHNGGTPPIRRPGDSLPPSPIARTQARLERTIEKKD
jgi:chemotaxis protein histidine kinase CheA